MTGYKKPSDDGDVGGLNEGVFSKRVDSLHGSHNILNFYIKSSILKPSLPDASWLAKARLCCLRPHLLDKRDNKVANELRRKATMGGDLNPRERQQLNAIFARLEAVHG